MPSKLILSLFLGIPDNEGIVMMFRTLVSTGISGFLGCPSVLYEQEFEHFFDTAFMLRRREPPWGSCSRSYGLGACDSSARGCPYPNDISCDTSRSNTRTPKRKLKLPVGSDDEIVETEPDVENVVEQQREKTTADDVDKIIDQVISETEKMETDMEAPSLTRSDDIIVEITERSMMRMIILMELKMKLLGN
ncbi:pentatricopeptide repeat-containing protein mitochondrial-like [Dorcoceras hygrometricum]|uniref:Pentatricopeptide repeat-containing protein mitochondrial-like n=1 Tax=Dorcoceras hygrometricum TaxID=472368 RepID=A0A2Z7AZD0_9LAMI|nr:pentatricopeptide repeat-containing protein mitochondrial-like [Dorcoceras hygrometricum]